MAQARTKKADIEASLNRDILIRWAVLTADGTPAPPPQRIDGTEFSPEEAADARHRLLAEIEDAKAGLLADPPNPGPFHACLAQYGPMGLGLVLGSPAVVAAMQWWWWGSAKWGTRSPERAHLTRVLKPIGAILARGVPGRGGNLTPTVKDKDRERAAGSHYKQKYDASRRAEKARLTTASPEDLEKALTSPSGPTRKAAEQVLHRRRNTAGR